MKYMLLLACISLPVLAKVVSVDAQKLNEYVKNNKAVVVKIYKKGCPPCERLAPEFTALSNESKFKGVTFVELHGPDNHDIVEAWNVEGYPTVFFVKDKKRARLSTSNLKGDLAKRV